MGADLNQKTFTHLDQLGSLRGQGSERTQIFRRKSASRIGSECKKTSDELRIDPVGLGAYATAFLQMPLPGRAAPAGRQRLPPRASPRAPFQTAGRLEANDGLPVASKVRDGSVPFWTIRHSASKPIGQAMKVQPVATDIYADDATM